ncbi:MAG: amino acid adenylation domain-containing protein [bacterium]|nr:amino acid adenylation domain-containing protein [bacterium]
MTKLDDLTLEQQALLTLQLLEKASEQAKQESQIRTIKPSPRNSDLPPSFAQQRLWFMEQLVPDNPFYNYLSATRLVGALDIAALMRTLDEIVKRHETLRTTFVVVNGRPVQVITPALAVPLPMLDLIPLPEIEREVEARRLATEEFHRPFDLEQGPVLRATLLRLEVEEHVLLLAMDHIVCDDWSLGILTQEIGPLYRAFTMGEPSPLPALPIQYADFAVWQREWLQGEVLEEQLAYWRAQLEGMPEVLELPADRPRPPMPTFHGATEPFELSTTLTEELKALGLQEEATLFMTLLAAFQTLLYRYTGQEDIVVGSGIANRNQAEIEGLIGFFVNMLLLRADLSGDPTFRELLGQVREVTLEAYAHQDIPFEAVVEQLQPERDLSWSPLLQVGLAFENAPMEPMELPGLTLSSLEFENRVSRFDLEFHLRERDTAGLQGRLVYNTDIFEAATVRRLLEHYRVLLKGIVANSDSRLSDLPLLTESEHRLLLVEWNDTEIDYPQDRCIHELFEAQAARTPDAVAVAACPSIGIERGEDADGGTSEQLSYARLNARANQLAHYLGKKGVGSGSIVAIMEDRTPPDTIAAILGVLKAGGAYLPLDTQNPMDRVLSLLDDSQTDVLLTRESIVKDIPFTRLQNLQDVSQDILLTSPRPPIQGLDALPFPDRSLVDYGKYDQYIGEGCVKKSMSIIATRGCPYKCAYCHRLWPKGHVVRSAQDIFQEVVFHYDRGYRNFTFLDDVFNLDRRNSAAFFELVIQNDLDIHILFPNGLRGDVLTPDYIDLMAEAGVVEMTLALETASPRLQRLIRKNLDIERLRENLLYICERHPHIVIDLFAMFGFPTETEEEALMTLDFIKEIKWLHFPYINVLKIFPNTDMARLAMAHGVSEEAIERSSNLQYHELGDTLPFSKSFAREYQSRFMGEYLLLTERLTSIIPIQKQVFTDDELFDKYDSLLPGGLESYPEITGLLGHDGFRPAHVVPGEGDASKTLPLISAREETDDEVSDAGSGLRVLLIDLSTHFSHETAQLAKAVEAPLGLMYLMTYLNQEFGDRVHGKILKSMIDFDSFEELRNFLDDFRPQVIGLRTLSLYRDFFHKTTSLIRQWYPDVPIITGGPYATSEYTTVLADRTVDVVVLGEGELTFAELIAKIIENDGRLPGDEVLEQIAGLAIIPRQRRKAGEAAGVGRQVLLLDRIEDEIAREESANLERVNQATDLAYVIYTSGSTGKPKGILIPRKALLNHAQALIEIYGLDPSHRLLQSITLSFDASAEEIFPTLLSGATLILPSATMALLGSHLTQLCQQQSISILHLPAALGHQWVDDMASGNGSTPDSLEILLMGGEQPALDKLKTLALLTKQQIRFLNAYGPTEATITTTVYETMCKVETLTSLPKIPMGRPIANTQVYLLDAHLQPVPVGVPGELHIGGMGLARGYLGHPGLTAERFIPDPYTDEPGKRFYKTGDLARYLPDGNIEFLGRIDHQVKVRGYRLELGEVEAALEQHPRVREAVVITSGDDMPGDPLAGLGTSERLVAYVVPEPYSRGASIEMQEWETEHVSLWQKLFEDTYSQPAGHQEPTFNIVGWNSSYTGLPIPAEKMRAWVENAVDQILSRRPSRVLEIGCGTGLLLYQIAPHCTQYCGTDFSESALRSLRSELNERGLSQVTLFQRMADDLEGIETEAFDAVILNSVAQYFPSIDYLLRVLEGAVNAAKPGGFVFVGDVRSLPLLEAFHTSIELERASAVLPVAELQRRVRRSIDREEEMIIEPAFFVALKQRWPKVSHVEILPKRGRVRNEMTKYRYEVILHVGRDVCFCGDHEWVDWQENGMTLLDVRRRLVADEPKVLGLRSVPNGRVLAEVRGLELLANFERTATVAELQEEVRGINGGIEPEDLWDLGGELGYAVEVRWPGAWDSYDVVFRWDTTECAERQEEKVSCFPGKTVCLKPWHEYANEPLQGVLARELMPQLRGFLQQKLPDYMIPSAFVVLDTMPLTPNGKVDRRALPASEGIRPELAGEYVAPRTPAEEMLVDIWAQVLNFERVGVHDNFFEMGGHSLLATQIVSRVRETFQVELPLRVLFETPTIVELARSIEAIRKTIRGSQALTEDGDYEEWEL